MEINMYCGAQLEYKQGVIHKLLQENIIKFCVTDYDPTSICEKPTYDSRIVTIDHRPCITSRYDLFDCN